MFSFFSALVLAEALVTLPLILDLPPLTQLSIKAVTLLKKSGSPGFMLIRSFSFAAITSLLTRILGIYKIQRRIWKLGSPTSADHFILRTYLLDAFLMGSSLFLLLVIRSLHNQFIEITSLKTELETLKTHSKHLEAQYLDLKTEKLDAIEREHVNAQKEIMSLKDIVAKLRERMENLLLESVEKDKAIKSAEVNAIALRRQTEGLSSEYHRLLDDNENLRDQLASFDRKASYSGIKKHA